MERGCSRYADAERCPVPRSGSPLSAPDSPGEPGPGGDADPAVGPGGDAQPGGAEAAGLSGAAPEEPDEEAAPARPSQNIAVQVGAAAPGLLGFERAPKGAHKTWRTKN